MEIEPLRAESTAVVNSSSLVVPSTQNTAPIHSFRCLYTYDLRRKAKRWQDGSVRFHTFNKRIMVYDISRNFIGDTHWRDAGIIEDGDELALDKGVLIQVGERTESVNQDLTGLFDKRGKKHVQPVENDETVGLVLPLLSPARPSGPPVPSQLRPKSLNAILGTRSGSLGRAALPLKFPCEIRQSNECDVGREREAKRRRVESLPKKVAPSITAHVSMKTSRLPDVEPNPGYETIRAAADEEQLARQISSAKTQTTKTRKLPTAKTPANTTTPRSSTDQPTRPHVEDDEITQPNTRSNPTHPPVPTVLLAAQPTRHNISVGAGIPRNREQHNTPPPMNQLRILSRKPRKKLIYQDHPLPSIAPIGRVLPDPGEEEKEEEEEDSSAKPVRKKRKPNDPPQLDFHRTQRERLDSRLRKHSTGEKLASDHDSLSKSIFISSSSSSSSDDDHEEADTHISPPPTLSPNPLITSTNNPPSKPTPSKEPNQSLPKRNKEPPPPSSSSFSQIPVLLPTRPSHQPSQTHNFLSPLPPLLPAPIPPKKRTPMRKTNSEPLCTFIPAPPSPSPAPAPAPDPGAATTTTTTPAPEKTKPKPGMEKGGEKEKESAKEKNPDPWSREAWDLFGFGRPLR